MSEHGESGTADAEAQTVAVLFTDIAGSTQRQTEVGDERFDDIRRAHFAALRAAAAAHLGTEAKNLGDGLMVVFRSASNAIAAAVEMQVECDRVGRKHPELAIGVKIGVSIGDVVVEEGDWFGTPVVEAARLCAACAAGQLLITETMRLMAGSRTRERIESIGELTLKGLPAPLATCEVRWEPVEIDAGVPLPGLFTGPTGMPFAGRSKEQAMLADVWHEARSNGRRVILVGGEPGIGKTRLVAELATGAHGEGAVVLAGRCDDDIEAPFRPFAEALDHLVRYTSDTVLVDHVAEVGTVLARIVPALAKRVDVEPELTTPDSDADRLRLFQAVLDLLRRQAAQSPVVLVLDDLHWADRSSLLLLRDLVRRLGDAPVLVVGTFRTTDLDRSHPLADMMADLRREPGVERVVLSGLSSADVLEYLTLAGGGELESEGIELGRQIAEVTSGNPFFVGETLRHLAESGAIVRHDGRWVRGTLDPSDVGVPEGVREVVGRRLSALDDDVQAVLTIAAVAGAEFDSSVIGAVAELSEGRVVDLLDEAAGRMLVAEDHDRFGWYRFAHALVRQTLLEELSTTRRLRLHRALGRQLEEQAPDRIEEIAHHYLEAAAAGVAERAVDYATRAGQAALDGLAVEQAVRWLRRALEAEEGLTPDPARRAELLIALGEASHWTDETLEVRDELLEAAELAADANRPDLLAMAAYWYLGPTGAFAQMADPHVRRLCENALDALDACPADEYLKERMWVLGKLSNSHLFDTDPTERLALSDAALAISRRLDDPFDRWLGIGWSIVSREPLGHYEEWEALVDEAAALARDLPATVKRDTLSWQAMVHQKQGDFEAVDRTVDQYRAVVEPLGLALPSIVFGSRAVRAADQGRFDDCRRFLDAWLEDSVRLDATRLGVIAAEGWPNQWTADATAYRASLGSVPEAATALVACYPLQAIVALIEDDIPAAKEAFDEWHELLPFVPYGFRTHAAAVATYPTWRLGSASVAESLLVDLRPHAGHWPTFGPASSNGPADLHIGVNLVTIGDLDGARVSLESALRACEAGRAIAWETVTALHLAEVALLQGRADDAQMMSDRCRRRADDFGMVLIGRELDRLGFKSETGASERRSI